MLPPALTGRHQHFQRLKLTGYITLRYHEGKLTRIEHGSTQRADDDCTCDPTMPSEPCVACVKDHRLQEQARAGMRGPS
jgi:hypothetical protein